MPVTKPKPLVFQIVSLFPEMFEGVLNSSMLWKAQKSGLVKFELINLREYGLGSRQQVDDTPYGGGDGMLLRPEPVFAAVEAAKAKQPGSEVILMTPRGEAYSQRLANQLQQNGLNKIIICSRYEGYDERIASLADRQISIGNYVLTGGELAAMVVIDSTVRLIPGVLGGKSSAANESFSHGNNIEHPHYTRPEVFKGLRVPEVLLSGNHAEIERWRTKNSQ